MHRQDMSVWELPRPHEMDSQNQQHRVTIYRKRMPDRFCWLAEEVFAVQNRLKWKQLVAGAAHLCKERVPE